jgi:hypothetical protein
LDRATRGSAWTLAALAGGASCVAAWLNGCSPRPESSSESDAEQASLGVVDPQAEDLERRLTSDVLPLLEEYCINCHDGREGTSSKGGVRFGEMRSLRKALVIADDLSMARELVRTKQMPPKGMSEPTDHERLILEQWLEAATEYVPPDAAVDPGWFTIHRLNRSEYRATLRDLLGIDPAKFDVAERLPKDDTGYGFDNIADVLTVSPLAMEQYLDAAERAVAHALGPIVVIGDEPKDVKPLRASGGGNSLPSGGVHLYSNGAAQGRIEFPATGEYLIRFSAWENQGGDGHAHLSLRIDGKEVHAVDVTGTTGEPQEFEVRTRVKEGKRLVAAAFTNDYYEPGKADRNLAVEWISVAGPLDEATTQRRQGWRAMFGSLAAQTDADAEQILGSFATRAFRRPMMDEERASLVGLYHSERERGASFEEAVRTGLSAVLVSPSFLFRSVANPDADDPTVSYQLDGYELASRLSYFLWSSMPDDALLEAARAGDLQEESVLREQIARMIADPKADAFIANFAGQWLHLRTLDTLAIDREKFKDYTDDLRKDMVQEATLYFGGVVRGTIAGGSILALLDGTSTMLNERLAKFYGIEGVAGSEFREVPIPLGSARAGVLTMAGVLTVTSNPTRTSPVKRGLFVLDQVLGTPPPPPPADIPPLEQANVPHESATLREQLAAHVANPSCAACHNRLDPIGLAFENFDAIGRWRVEEGGKPIDASGTLPGGERLTGVADLRAVLMNRGDQFVETMSGKVLTYALGRGLEPFDRPAVRAIAARTKAEGGTFSSLIESVVLSETFRTCRGRASENETDNVDVDAAVAED